MANRDRRVFMLLENAYPVSGGGGAERQVGVLSRWFTQRGIGVTIITPRVAWGPQTVRDQVDGAEVQRIAYPQLRIFGGFVLLLRLAVLLWRRRKDYDAIHAHIAHQMAALGSVVGSVLGKPVVVKLTGWLEMEQGVLSGKPSIRNWTQRWALGKATWLQATSTRIAHGLEQAGFDPGRIVIVPNSVNVERFAGRGSRQPAESARRGVYVGRLVPEKAVDVLLEALARSGTDLELVLVGDGSDRAALEDRAKKLDLVDRVRFAGASENVEPFLADADFAVLPSHYEGLSNTLLEYLAASLPVVASRVSGSEDFVVPTDNGWIFEPGDVDGLAACLAEVAGAPVEKLVSMGKAGRKRVISSASVDVIGGRLLELYGVRRSEEA